MEGHFPLIPIYAVAHVLCQVGESIPYGEKFSRDKIFADWPLAKISRKNFRGSTITKHTARSLVPRPLPEFSPQLRDKIWEWPGDEATQHARRSQNFAVKIFAV